MLHAAALHGSNESIHLFAAIRVGALAVVEGVERVGALRE